MHLQEGAIYKDKSNNVIRLLSIRGNYCVYVYVSLANVQYSMHGLVTGLARRDVFADHCTFAADSVKEWISKSAAKHDEGSHSRVRPPKAYLASIAQPDTLRWCQKNEDGGPRF
jgi:hypothetical protein